MGHGNERTSRGGRGADFNWDELRGDKQAAAGEFYLGRSEKCEDLWYAKSKVNKIPARVADQQRQEVEAVQQAERELMQAALGLKPKAVVIESLTRQQIDVLMGRDPTPDQPAEKSKKGKKDLATALFNSGATKVKKEKKEKREKRKGRHHHKRKRSPSSSSDLGGP
eukprot:EG_transcript_35622